MKKRKILILDDDTRILKLLKKLLEKNFFEVHTASSSSKALDLIEQIDFDLLILDIMMPVVTGVEFAQKIRAQENPIPIVMLTALSSDEDIKNALEAGADDYVIKPFDSIDMISRINKLLDNK